MEKSLGTLIVRPDGKGLYTKSTDALTVDVRMFVDSVERDNEGKIEYAVCNVRIYFNPSQWPVDEKGDLYSDRAVERQVNDFLESLGYTGQVNWSEAGMQDYNFGDFDAPYSLIHQVFPEIPEIDL